MDQAQGTQQVDLDQGDDALPRHGSERSLGVDAGVVEENVEPVTAGLAELGNGGEERRSVGHVEAVGRLRLLRPVRRSGPRARPH